MKHFLILMIAELRRIYVSVIINIFAASQSASCERGVKLCQPIITKSKLLIGPRITDYFGCRIATIRLPDLLHRSRPSPRRIRTGKPKSFRSFPGIRFNRWTSCLFVCLSVCLSVCQPFFFRFNKKNKQTNQKEPRVMSKKVVLYSTSASFSAPLKKKIAGMKQLLDIKKVTYEVGGS